MAGYLEAIVDLQSTLDDFTTFNLKLNSIPEWMTELHEQYSEKKSEIDRLEEQAQEADRLRRAAEGELTDAQAKLKQFQEQIGRVSTQREYGALLKEIDSFKEKISEAEKQALEALENKEQAESELGELKEGFRELDEQYQAELVKWEAEKPSVARSVKSLDQRSKKLKTKIPRNVLALFERIYDRYGTAVSRVIRTEARRGSNAMWHCDLCNYNVRPQIVVELRNEGTINQCESCKRFLYWTEEPETDED